MLRAENRSGVVSAGRRVGMPQLCRRWLTAATACRDYARPHKHRRMRAVALVTAGHTSGPRGRKLRMGQEPMAADPSSTGPVNRAVVRS